MQRIDLNQFFKAGWSIVGLLWGCRWIMLHKWKLVNLLDDIITFQMKTRIDCNFRSHPEPFPSWYKFYTMNGRKSSRAPRNRKWNYTIFSLLNLYVLCIAKYNKNIFRSQKVLAAREIFIRLDFHILLLSWLLIFHSMLLVSGFVCLRFPN